MSYRELVMLQRPTFYLPFEESSGGVAADITGNGFDAIYNNISLASPSGFAVFGGPVTRATWNGTSSYASIAKRWMRGSAISISGWAKPSTVAGWRKLFHLTNSTTSAAGPTVYASNSGDGKYNLTSQPLNGSNVNISSASALSVANQIGHFAVVAKGPLATVYFNGVAVISFSSASYGGFAPSSPVLPITIGAGYASTATVTDFFAGWISNIAAWDRPLTAAEVLQQYLVGKAVFDQPYISGNVLDNGVGMAKRVKWMRRDSGLLVAAASSAADGSFTIKTTSDVGMAVCLDDALTAYPPLIFDRVTPQV